MKQTAVCKMCRKYEPVDPKVEKICLTLGQFAKLLIVIFVVVQVFQKIALFKTVIQRKKERKKERKKKNAMKDGFDEKLNLHVKQI